MALDLCPRVRQVLQLFFFPFLFLFFTTNQQDVAQLDTSQQFGRFKYNTATVTNYPKLLLWIPITKHCYPLLFPHLILLEVWQEWGCESSCCIFSSHCVWKSINVCLVEGHVSKEMRWSQREREREGGCDRLWEKELFLPSLHVKLELLLQQTGSEQIYTHKHAPNHLVRAGSIRHLSNLSHAHSHTHTHLLLSHTHWTFQMGRSSIQWRWATAVEEWALRTVLSFVFLLEFLEFVHVKCLIFEHSCEEGWIRRHVGLNGLTKTRVSCRDEVRLVFTWAVHDL